MAIQVRVWLFCTDTDTNARRAVLQKLFELLPKLRGVGKGCEERMPVSEKEGVHMDVCCVLDSFP